MYPRDTPTVVYLFGIKNDYYRKGFQFLVPMASDPVICPVRALKDYVLRTQHLVMRNGQVFLSLNRPYKGLTATGIVNILNKSIELVGLKSQGFSAKCFCPCGATSAVEAGVNPDFITSVGRWKNRQVFDTHYVHANPPAGFTDSILCIN